MQKKEWNDPWQWNLKSQPDCDPLYSESCDICSGAEISEQQLRDSGTAVEERCSTERRAWSLRKQVVQMYEMTLIHLHTHTHVPRTHQIIYTWPNTTHTAIVPAVQEVYCINSQWDTAVLFKRLFCTSEPTSSASTTQVKTPLNIETNQGWNTCYFTPN